MKIIKTLARIIIGFVLISPTRRGDVDYIDQLEDDLKVGLSLGVKSR